MQKFWIKHFQKLNLSKFLNVKNKNTDTFALYMASFKKRDKIKILFN